METFVVVEEAQETDFDSLKSFNSAQLRLFSQLWTPNISEKGASGNCPYAGVSMELLQL